MPGGKKVGDQCQDQKGVNIDFPGWMIHSLDKEAKRLGVPRQSMIKICITERLKDGFC